MKFFTQTIKFAKLCKKLFFFYSKHPKSYVLICTIEHEKQCEYLKFCKHLQPPHHSMITPTQKQIKLSLVSRGSFILNPHLGMKSLIPAQCWTERKTFLNVANANANSHWKQIKLSFLFRFLIWPFLQSSANKIFIESNWKNVWKWVFCKKW